MLFAILRWLCHMVTIYQHLGLPASCLVRLLGYWVYSDILISAHHKINQHEFRVIYSFTVPYASRHINVTWSHVVQGSFLKWHDQHFAMFSWGIIDGLVYYPYIICVINNVSIVTLRCSHQFCFICCLRDCWKCYCYVRLFMWDPFSFQQNLNQFSGGPQ